VLDVGFPVGAELIEAEAIRCCIGLLQKTRTKPYRLWGIDFAFEYGLLHALSKVAAAALQIPA
jgi:hypothetical protein